MPYDFKDKIILITGAGSGIGRATAIKLATLHATLALCDTNYDALLQTAKLCGSTPTPYIADVDVSSAKEVLTFVEEAVKRLGGLHHVFNCAGVNPTSIPLEETTDAYFDTLVGVNLRGVFNVTRACIPHMHSGASFVNVSSVSATRPSPQQAVYAATKAGLTAFSKGLALELGPRGIRTNVVAPGYIDTPTNAGVVKGGDAVGRMERGCAMGRLGGAGEVADVVAWLMSGEAGYVNGSVVEVDGGIRG